MEKIFRFAARRPALFRILPCLFPALPLAVMLISLEVPTWIAIACIAAVLYPFFIIPKLSEFFLMNPKIKVLNQECDPIPLLEITSFLLTCRQSPAYRITTSMNHAVALRDLGSCEEALRIMENIDLSRPRRIPAMVKFVYYHNWSDFLDHSGRMDEADAMHRTAMEFYDAIPRKQKSALENTVCFSRASALCRHGSFTEAVALLRDMNCANLRQQVERGMLLARCSIALGQSPRAREWLQYIIDHGNRLHMVSQARKMLEDLENS